MNGAAAYAANSLNTASADSLVISCAGLVKRIAHHLIARLPDSVQLDDLIQAGMIGVLEASKNYDAGKGASFETYAGIRIRGAMLDELRRNDWAPRSVHRYGRDISQAIAKVEARTSAEARDVDVAKQMNVSLDEYHKMLKHSDSGRLVSIDLLSEFGDAPFVEANETVAPDFGVTDENFRRDLAKAISRLPEREALVLSLYYTDELNLKEIGQVLGVSESRVSQIHSQAVVRLRARMQDWS